MAVEARNYLFNPNFIKKLERALYGKKNKKEEDMGRQERKEMGIDTKAEIKRVERELLETRQVLQGFMECFNPELSSFQAMEEELDSIKKVVEDGAELEEELDDLEKELAFERADEME